MRSPPPWQPKERKYEETHQFLEHVTAQNAPEDLPGIYLLLDNYAHDETNPTTVVAVAEAVGSMFKEEVILARLRHTSLAKILTQWGLGCHPMLSSLQKLMLSIELNCWCPALGPYPTLHIDPRGLAISPMLRINSPNPQQHYPLPTLSYLPHLIGGIVPHPIHYITQTQPTA
jgi:hypothetical protein